MGCERGGKANRDRFGRGPRERVAQGEKQTRPGQEIGQNDRGRRTAAGQGAPRDNPAALDRDQREDEIDCAPVKKIRGHRPASLATSKRLPRAP